MSTFIYIQTVDCGLAPCVREEIWSLAICKPGIRKQAQKGDIVIAGTEKADWRRLSSWARIKERITTDGYFRGYSNLIGWKSSRPRKHCSRRLVILSSTLWAN